MSRRVSLKSPTFGKLEKAVAVSGVFAGVLEESSREIPGKLVENFSELRNALNSRISGTGKGKPAEVHTALDIVLTFRGGCFSQSTVPAFSSFSD